MNPSDLPLTQSLSPLASQHGVDLTPLAIAEMAWNEMLASARKFDGSYEAAKARFEAAIQGASR